MKNEGMLLLPAIAFSQSSYEGYEASKAIDHNENTSWKAGPYYQWLLIDLQNVCYVSSVHIQFFSDYCNLIINMIIFLKICEYKGGNCDVGIK